MDLEHVSPETWKLLEDIVGYLNFSSGSPDPHFLGNLNRLFGVLGRQDQRDWPRPEQPLWCEVRQLLWAAVERLRSAGGVFARPEQAEAALHLTFEYVLPGYRQHHRDLLFHQTEEALFQPFFLGRVLEAVLQQGPPWEESQRVVSGCLRQLNNFIGHRPVPVLQTAQKIEPYAHEWVAPIPLFIAGAGVAVGRYQDLVSKALEILQATEPRLLAQAWFHPEWLSELALDPRAYDFDHPVNKRPNYHFGQWDPHLIDNAGRYRRFILHEVTLDAMLVRVEQRGKLSYDQILYEAAAVLAGTILMAGGVSGSGPGMHDSSVTLSTLLPRIAAYRDAFYEWLLKGLQGAHGTRLREEATNLRQPFGGARQHLNQQLARRRAMQVQHTHLAQFYSWMGYTEAAASQAEIVPVASARMMCQVYCRLTAARLAIDAGNLAEAAAALPEVEDLLHRAIECGAMADPWNILGFGAQYSLFPAVENSVHDYRLDELIELMRQIFALYTRLQKEAVAAGDRELPQQLSRGMQQLARWWDKYASVEVGDVEGFSGRQAWESAEHVADVLRAWHAAGTAAGDLAFWRGRLEQFTSAKAYALVVESLLEQEDLVAAMALLIQWLSRAAEIPLEDMDYSFHELTRRWMENLLTADSPDPTPAPQTRWALARKMLDYMEANAEEYWLVPRLELEDAAQAEEADDDEEDGLFAAAYEDVTFRDSADDGMEGEMLQGGAAPATDFELNYEAERIAARLNFLTTLAHLWKRVASALGAVPEEAAERQGVLAGWLDQAGRNHKQLSALLTAIDRYPIPTPRSNQESLVEYDRRRSVKEHVLEQVIATSVETADAARSLRAAIDRHEPEADLPAWEHAAQRVLRAVFRGDAQEGRAAWPDLIQALADQPLLYVALAKGGSPQRIVASRNVQRVLRRLLAYLPRLGLLEETYQLIETIQEMEQNHAVGPGAITEFDQMFDIGCRGIARCLADSSRDWYPTAPLAADTDNPADLELIACLERAVEALLQSWLDHSRRVRLSVLENVSDESRWKALRQFVELYGHDLFTQKFMNLGNLRAILHQGVDAWLQSLQEDPDEAEELRLLADLDHRLPRQEAVEWLSIIIEAVVENYGEYIDYNSTTTQSDRGEMLYTLLDFLRLQSSYNRVAWNLRPVIVAHEVLVRSGQDQAAHIWRQAVAQRTADIANEHLKRFARLNRQYGMRLPSVAERLEERFVRPLTIDRLRALVRPAIEELRAGTEASSLQQLQEGIQPLIEEPAGVGFDVPGWLEAMEDELEVLRSGMDEDEEPLDPDLPVPQARLSRQDAEKQITRMLGGTT